MEAKLLLLMWKIEESEVLIEKSTLEVRAALWAKIWEEENRDPQSFGQLYIWNLDTPLDYFNRTQMSEKEEKRSKL